MHLLKKQNIYHDKRKIEKKSTTYQQDASHQTKGEATSEVTLVAEKQNV